ncbi:hypothetical protein MCOR25_003084 [Pyricularia grisea]|uniref:Rhodopsin domain-containing protein n=1 Tax=Pyricularia grisea TaxID=148305 RepID=A0A6P8B964_PYRGI|nr:uncharacterized protein PgNI_04372 [Pyricularia grisea]KAI6374822.1 hypothetical protein MCOR25_003084 [Pyricularia grisea]TLD12346.1 hypothetical protein PgNI_04372 [Pyricularia grisea]
MAPTARPIIISDRAVFVGQVFYGIGIPLLVLATVTLGYRMFQINARRALWSDGCIVVGYILTVACLGLFVPQSFLTPGIKSPEAILEGQKGSFLSIPIWGMSMAFIKASIGLTLLQIQNQRWFQILIWSNIAASVAYGFGNMGFILLSCRPLQAAWGDFADPTKAQCLPSTYIRKAALTGAVVSVVTDLMLSLAPISFLWTLKRPLRERIVLGCLMSLGLLAAMSSVAKNLIIADFGKENVDVWAMNISISTWTACEMLLGIIAACTPFCRPVLEKCFINMGISLTGTAKSSKALVKNYGISCSRRLGAYRRATAGDTFGSSVAAGAPPRIDQQLTQFESDEDPLKSGIQLQSPRLHAGGAEGSGSPGSLTVNRSNSGIYKTTDIHMQTTEANGSQTWPLEERRYYPDSAV